MGERGVEDVREEGEDAEGEPPDVRIAKADRRIEELGVAALPREAARVARIPEMGERDPVRLGHLVAGGEGGELLAQVVDEGGEHHPAAAAAEADEDVRERADP